MKGESSRCVDRQGAGRREGRAEKGEEKEHRKKQINKARKKETCDSWMLRLVDLP